jgi:O-antigen/teichoic acid export membrane protein
MLKRLVIIGILTGIGQLFSLLTIKWIAQKSTVEEISQLGQVDSLYQLLLNIIALGLQSAAMRDIATTAHWEQDFKRVQSARFTMGLLLLPIGFFAFYNQAYGVFLLAPLMALSADYALYSLGFPVKGAFVSFCRTLIPYGLVLIAAFAFGGQITIYFLLGMMVAYIVTNLFINRSIRTEAFSPPAWSNFSLYVRTIPLGLVNLSFYVLGLGMLLIIPPFYGKTEIVVAIIGLKIHTIVKSVLRIVHQAFLKDMTRDEACLQVDQLCSLVGLLFASAVMIFPASFITIFAGRENIDATPFFRLLSIAVFVYTLFSSLTTRSLLSKRDVQYSIVAGIAAALALLLPISFSTWSKDIVWIGWTLLICESLFALLMVIFFSGGIYIGARLMFYLKNLLFVAIPAGIYLLLGDSIIGLVTATGLMAAAMGAIYYRRFLPVA